MEDDTDGGVEESNDGSELRKVVYVHDSALLLSQVKSYTQDISKIGECRAKMRPFGVSMVPSRWLYNHAEPVQQFFQDTL
jgi:hypothetical protein